MGSLVKIKTADAPRLAIDWLVAKAEGLRVVYHDDGITRCIMKLQNGSDQLYAGRFAPTADPAQAWPIIERGHIWLRGPDDAIIKGTVVLHVDYWYAHKKHQHVQNGLTSLIAAMRCHCASVYGEEVEVPEELLQ